MTTQPPRTRVDITIDVYDQPPLTILLWAHLCAHQLTDQLDHHSVIAHVANVDIDTYPTLNN